MRGHRAGGTAAAALPLVDRLRREIAKVQVQVDLLRTVRDLERLLAEAEAETGAEPAG